MTLQGIDFDVPLAQLNQTQDFTLHKRELSPSSSRDSSPYQREETPTPIHNIADATLRPLSNSELLNLPNNNNGNITLPKRRSVSSSNGSSSMLTQKIPSSPQLLAATDSHSRSRTGPRSRSSSRQRTLSNSLHPSSSAGLHSSISSNTGKNTNGPGMTLWRLLLIELNIPDLNDNDQQKQIIAENSLDTSLNSEILMNFIKLPAFVEKFMIYGLVYCTIVFLKMLTIVPLRFTIHCCSFARSLFNNNTKAAAEKQSVLIKFIRLKNDLITVLLTVATLWLLQGMDSSRIYHNIRAGTAVKLYFMVGALEIADKLLSAVGQDLIKIIYNIKLHNVRSEVLSLNYKQLSTCIVVFAITVVYLSVHSHVLVYQVMALNVAINSYSNALLTLILSNQFAELKGAVFKKSEREGLFQITCADLNERFHVLLILFIISSRNLFQLYATGSSGSNLFNSLKPNSWYSQITFSQTMNDWIGFLMGPMFIVIGSEVLVDWLKHAYITKFNRIKPQIYNRYMRVLATDYITSVKANFYNSQSDTESEEHPEMLLRRTGLPIITIIVIFIKMAIHPWLKYFLYDTDSGNFSIIGALLVLLSFGLIIFLRLILSLILIQWSNRILRSGITKPLNDYVKGNPNVSLTDVNGPSVRKLFYDKDEPIPPSLEEIRINKVLSKADGATGDHLDSVVRFDMADKRIW